jgi:hypothetical protein
VANRSDAQRGEIVSRQFRQGSAQPLGHIDSNAGAPDVRSTVLMSNRPYEMDDLPPPNTTRWVARRKAAVVAAVRNDRITMEEALRRYQLSEEEFLSWHRTFETHGLAGLRATRVQHDRWSRPPSGPRSRR